MQLDELIERLKLASFSGVAHEWYETEECRTAIMEQLLKLYSALSRIEWFLAQLDVEQKHSAGLQSRLDTALALLREVRDANNTNADATFLGGELEDRISDFVVERQSENCEHD